MATVTANAPIKIIDADTHLTEPHDMWTRRAPAKYRDRVPQVKMHEGVRSWIIDGDKSIGEYEAQVKAARAGGARFVMIATDGVFSMDGSIADLKAVKDGDDVAGIRGETDAARALMQVLAACRAGVANWHPLEADSPLEALAHRLSGGQLRALLSLAASVKTGARLPTYRLMTRAQWLATPPQGEPRKIWLAGGPNFVLEAQVACAFRSRHPGAKLLVSWLQWPLAQKAVKASRPGWQGPKA